MPVRGVVAWANLGHVAGIAIVPSLGLQLPLLLLGLGLQLPLPLPLLVPDSPVAPAVSVCLGYASESVNESNWAHLEPRPIPSRHPLASVTSTNPLTLLVSAELSSVLPLPPLDPTRADRPHPEGAMAVLEASSGWVHEEAETRALGPVASASLPSLSPRGAAAAAASQNAMAKGMPGVREEVAVAAAVAKVGLHCCCCLLLGVWEQVVAVVMVAKVGLLHRCHLLLRSPAI